MNRLRTHALAIAVVLLPGIAGAFTFDLPRLDFPDNGTSVTKGCTRPATLGTACPTGH